MTERVAEVDLGVRWEPNAPDAVTVSDGTTLALAMRAHPDDADQGSVVLRWSGVVWLCIGLPNDESLRHHRLYDRGLSQIIWAGEVQSSDLISTLAPMAHAVRALTHHVVVLKEGLLEVVARSVTSDRSEHATCEAAAQAII